MAELDRTVPALLVKVGRYPQHHGGLGVVRTLARAGVPVHAVVESPATPVALSRYLTGYAVRPTTGCEPPAQLVDLLRAVGERIGRPAVAVPTDDEAAVLLAEHGAELAPYFLLPPVAAGLPRRLASKAGLHELCRRHGVSAPRSAAVADQAALLALGREWGYPLVLKNLEAFTRLRAPVVRHTTLVRDEAELTAMVPDRPLSVLAQEYLPAERSEDWITHLCCGPGGEARVAFSGRKLRSWPPESGVTTRAVALVNRQLLLQAEQFCRQIGYVGVADLDWRLDLRDGRYKLLDFNPRTGAQFRLFEDEHGVDVVRALHLECTGRPVRPAAQRAPRVFAVGQLDLPSALCWTARHRRLPRAVLPRRGTERAWLSLDDPLPAAVEACWFAGTVARRLSQRRPG
ncbi:ATP-grasp domain-containing protein [Streptomyces tateyamensis]|uniref:carboxylate--amine ligase n=1 Tax=Streptomyces tateyamensis TaxID=565073 RepID=UPI0015E87A11|nr:ATP-grasp domain-containing protein [Streptomyces tateyamensis]